MPSTFDQLSVRDFSNADFADKDGHAAHATAHASGLPLLDDEIACWPDGVDVLPDRYAKRSKTTSRSGLRGTVWTPLFNRPLLFASEPLIPSTYLSGANVAAHGMTEQHHWSVIHLNDLIPANDDPFLHSLGASVSLRNPYYSRARGTGSPVVISTRVMPSENTSERWSASPCSQRSGAM